MIYRQKDLLYTHSGTGTGANAMSESEKKKAWTKIYRQKPEVKKWYKEYNREWSKKHLEQRRESRRADQLRRKYGLTTADFDALLVGQGNKCACCGATDWGGRGPFVDHCHATGKVRGILCMMCNIGAGAMVDNPKRAEQMVTYLKKHKEKKT